MQLGVDNLAAAIYTEKKRLVNMQLTIFNEYFSPSVGGKPPKNAPESIHTLLAGCFAEDTVCVATQEMPENGLTQDILDKTDVLIWRSSVRNEYVLDSIAEKVASRVLQGMGIVFLGQGYASKPFGLLTGYTPQAATDDGSESLKLICIDPLHPVASGIPSSIRIEHDFIVAEPTSVALPECLIYLEGSRGGDAARAVFTYTRGKGKIVCIAAGGDRSDAYRNPAFLQLIKNAVAWSMPSVAEPIVTAKEEPAVKKSFFKRFYGK